MGNKKSIKHDRAWDEAKRRCRLSNEDIRMAKELGMSPRGLIKNIPSKAQRWKAPVNLWIRNLYAKRFGVPCNTPGAPIDPPPLVVPENHVAACWDAGECLEEIPF